MAITNEQLEYLIKQIQNTKIKHGGFVPILSEQTIFANQPYIADISSINYKANKLSFFITRPISEDFCSKFEDVYQIDINYEDSALSYVHDRKEWYMMDDLNWNLKEVSLVEKGITTLSKDTIKTLFSTLHDRIQIAYNKQEYLKQQEKELFQQRRKTEPYVVFAECYKKNKEMFLESDPLVDKENLMSAALQESFNDCGYSIPAFCTIQNNEITLFKKSEINYNCKENVDYIEKKYVPYQTLSIMHEDFDINECMLLPIRSDEFFAFRLDKEHFSILQDNIIYNCPALYQAAFPYSIYVTEDEIHIKFDMSLDEGLQPFLDRHTNLQSKLDKYYDGQKYIDLDIEEEDCVLEMFYHKDDGLHFKFELSFRHLINDTLKSIPTDYIDYTFKLSQEETLILLDKICHILEKEDSKDTLEKIQYIKNVIEEIQTLEVEEPEI